MPSRGERVVLAIFGSVRDQLPALLQALGAIALALYPLPRGPGRAALIAVGVLISLTGVALAFARRPSRSQLSAEVGLLRARVESYEAPSSERVTFVLRSLLSDLKIEGPRSRASVFIPLDSDEKQWRLIARYSSDASLTKPGRSVHAADRGLVAETWRVGQSYRSDLPARRGTWDAAVSAAFHMPAAEVQKLRMQSRSYGCVRIDRPQGAVSRPVGVLIVENLDPVGVKPEMLDEMIAYALLPLISTECAFQTDLRAAVIHAG